MAGLGRRCAQQREVAAQPHSFEYVTLQIAFLFDKAGIWLFVGAIHYLLLGSFPATQAADLIGGV